MFASPPGWEESFPPGIKIGAVTAVESQKTLSEEDFSFGIFKRIRVKPFVDLSTLEEVFILQVETAAEGEEWSGRE